MDESWWVAEFHSGVSQEQRDGISDKAPCYNSLAPCTLTPVLQTCHKERGQLLSLRSFTAAPGRSHFIKYPSGLDKHSSQLAFQLQQENTTWGEPWAWPYLKSVPSPYLGVHNSVLRDIGGTKAAIPFSIYLWTWCAWRWLILFETYWHYLLPHTALATNFRSSQPTVKRVTLFNLFKIDHLWSAY